MSKKVLLSGVKPTGAPHIGNYFGAMKQFVDLQKDHCGYIFIADYHALNFIQNREEMQKNIIGVLLDYLAIGLDPEKLILFKQSDISEHTELAWIFDTLTTMPYLMRAHAFKDAEAKNKEISIGTFNYPMLMAADILIYNPDIVPIGSDQKQHVEIARDTAEKFNRIFGETFKLPESKIIEEVAIIPGVDGKKMSKSYNNHIPLFAGYEEIKKCVMSIVTDSGEGIPKNVYAIHKLFRSEEELKNIYKEKEGKYKELKELLIEDIEKFIAPLREKRKEFEKDIPKILAILKAGGEKAKKIAEEKMKEVREKIGVSV
ncbi:MAG: Tryptophan-tRNA ligase [Candidatus Nomurabacteria bacterium GW2011_GWE1_32_28]|uniref:Tryptophan--tRNA ligase n=1 Tax=Candidatus Nomurabacteria bacterium GW2011_GWF1_31_48 TaxID=1618767 RepID=A0A0G0AVM4_9BACT|nr:MAG: Tryptophan-tRNA ligase [Candidatus Nomurabacteria bacterium GW2011_GWF2_30_133]KKP28947.1 MAG: Tryptophan-tRNA ligase [Candidatus Nomurabacteria bacterium GW2011_GWE2_31_40]KKP30685.1 MAG: Tryptophan-tRNA ligase [Candidatus Nomurabacteria bacterium GW2011_GWF1_31_48]KKP35203.1 MAG: Tryptophan-tRNA ligase [Candidatus Nomurabacteria bacterium GW2011_GWE1_32_28]HAS80513.1 tryptophan--tRNA ligase [Candidatus Nomurabacteria bacterium]